MRLELVTNCEIRSCLALWHAGGASPSLTHIRHGESKGTRLTSSLIMLNGGVTRAYGYSSSGSPMSCGAMTDAQLRIFAQLR